MHATVRGLLVAGIVLVNLMVACAPATRTRNWVSMPEAQSVQRKAFDARLTPIKEDENFYGAFQLTITNKTDTALQIDWNKTRYLQNGKDNGIFIYAGLAAKQISEPRALEDIAAGTTFEREIWPVKLVAFKPIQSRYVNEDSFSLGPMPEGTNGVLLVMQIQGQERRTKIEVTLARSQQ
jgi:hypothetical protein